MPMRRYFTRLIEILSDKWSEERCRDAKIKYDKMVQKKVEERLNNYRKRNE